MSDNEHTEQSERAKLQANMTPEVLRLIDEVIPFRLRLLRNGSLISLSVLHKCLNEISQEFGAPDGAMCRTAIAPDAALLAADKAGGEVVRYCYECGTIGEVGEGKRDCCPDGSHAKYVHPVIAEQAQVGFYPSLKSRPQPQIISDATLKEKP